MKKILFALALVSASATISLAQKNTAPPTAAEAPRLDMVSKTNELEASLIRKRPEMTSVVMPQIMGAMQMRIDYNLKMAESLSGDAQMKLRANVKAEQMLSIAFKRLSADPVKNQKELISTARKFIEIY